VKGWGRIGRYSEVVRQRHNMQLGHDCNHAMQEWSVIRTLDFTTIKRYVPSFKSSVFSARCNIYISRLCYDVSVRLSVRLSVCLSVAEVHWRIIANLGFKFRSKFTAHCRNNNISRYASHC